MGQREVLALITNLIAANAPVGWTHAVGSFRATGGHMECPPLMVWELDGSVYPWEAPEALAFLFDRLRAGMYYLRVNDEPETGRGTWSSVDFTVVLDQPCRINVKYGWDVEPQWSKEPSAEAVLGELERFPRRDADIPEWMRQRAGLPAPEQPDSE